MTAIVSLLYVLENGASAEIAAGERVLIQGESGTGKELVARAIGLSGFVPFHEDTQLFAGDLLGRQPLDLEPERVRELDIGEGRHLGHRSEPVQHHSQHRGGRE